MFSGISRFGSLLSPAPTRRQIHKTSAFIYGHWGLKFPLPPNRQVQSRIHDFSYPDSLTRLPRTSFRSSLLLLFLRMKPTFPGYSGTTLLDCNTDITLLHSFYMRTESALQWILLMVQLGCKICSSPCCKVPCFAFEAPVRGTYRY